MRRKPKIVKRKAKEKPYKLFPFVTDVHLFDHSEGTFSDFGQRKRVYVHLVPAPWPRVIMLSLAYAMAVNFAKMIWFEVFGVPQWHIVASEELEPAPDQAAPQKPESPPSRAPLFGPRPGTATVRTG